FSLGGPIHNDRLFFYVAGEQEHVTEDSASEISRSARTRINDALAAGASPKLPVRFLQSGRFPVGADQTEAAGKLTYLTGRHTLNTRYSFTNSRLREDAFNTDEFSDVSARGSSYTKDHQLTGSDVFVMSPTAINELRFQISPRRVLSRATETNGP